MGRPYETQLTDREFAVAWQVYRGLQNKEIAHKLGVSTASIKQSMRQIFSKLNVCCRTDVAMWILRHTGIWQNYQGEGR